MHDVQTQLRASMKKHIEWIDLRNEGIMTECAILKKLPNGDTLYITVESLDVVDKRRLVGILSKPRSETVDLSDVLSQTTLNNGINALHYFHQLAMVRTANGQIMKPMLGRMGAAVKKPNSVVQAQTDTVVKAQAQTTPEVPSVPLESVAPTESVALVNPAPVESKVESTQTTTQVVTNAPTPKRQSTYKPKGK